MKKYMIAVIAAVMVISLNAAAVSAASPDAGTSASSNLTTSNVATVYYCNQNQNCVLEFSSPYFYYSVNFKWTGSDARTWGASCTADQGFSVSACWQTALTWGYPYIKAYGKATNVLGGAIIDQDLIYYNGNMSISCTAGVGTSIWVNDIWVQNC